MNKTIEGLKEVTKKTAKTVHEYFYSISLPQQDSPILIAAIIMALEDEDFRNSYRSISRTDKFVKDFMEAIEHSVLEFKGIDEKDKKLIFEAFNFIKLNKQLNEEEDGKIVLRELTLTIEETIYGIAKKYTSYDVIGEFYNEFTRYSSSDQQNLGIVLTPHHVAEFMSDLLDVTDDDVILDVACGSGSLLLTAEASNGSVGDNKILGVELNNRMMALCVSNMIIRGIDSHLWLGDSWKENIQEEIKKFKPTKMILNPPYDVSGYPELGFVSKGLDMLEVGGKAVVILPMSCAIKQTSEWKAWRKKILDKHKLLATFSMPDQLFYPVGAVTIVMVFEAGTPNGNNETFFGYLKDDGFKIIQSEGRIDTNNKWFGIRSEMMTLYENKDIEAGKSAFANVDEKAEWCCEAYMETDYDDLCDDSFSAIIKRSLAAAIKEEI